MPQREYDIGACGVFFKASGAQSETDIGHTSGGVKVTVNTETQAVEVDQLMDPVNEFVTKRTISVSVPLAEFSLANLQLAFPGSEVVIDAQEATKKKLIISSVSGQSARDFAGELRLHPVTAASADDKSKDFFFPAAAPLSTSLEIQYTKDGLKTIPIEFKVYPSTATATLGQSLIIGDPSAAA